MDNQANPILIDEDSSLNQEQETSDEEEEPMEEAHEEDDDQVACFDKNGNLVEQRGNFCFHYPNCSIHRSPMFRNTH